MPTLGGSENPALAWFVTVAVAAAVIAAPLPGVYVLGGLALVVMTAMSIAPFSPWHAAALGLSVEIVYFLWERVISSLPRDRAGDYIFLTLVTVAAASVTASRHARRNARILARQEAIRSAEALTGAQLRAQLAENAISIGKMAAGLSHEINSPLGALRSSIQTLAAVAAARGADSSEPIRELFANLQEAAARIDEVARRLRRFGNLEEAELKSANLNELLMDVTQMHEAEIQERKVQVEFDLERSLPTLTCRPQLLTAAFSSMLCNAIQAVNGDGRIGISTRLRNLEVEVVIRDNGRGMPSEQVDTLFEPSFKVAGNRVASGNWSLFNARQIVYEHGGAITVETAEGAGTSMHVVLPIG